NRSKSLILRITSLGCATASLPFVKRAKGGGDRGLASRRPFRGYADSVPAMTDTIPLIIQNCPASFRSTVRHAIGMLSAIRPESRPSWAGARTFRARSTTAFFSAANSAWKSSGPRYAFISSSMTSCLIFFSVIPSSVTHGMTPHTKSQIGPSAAHGELCEEPKEFGGVGRIVVQDSGGPFGPHLHGVFEAHLAWMQAGIVRGLRHQQADQVVGQQVHPQLLLDHLRRLAAEHVHAQGGFYVSAVQLHMPTPRLQARQLALGGLARIAQGRDQHSTLNLGFPNDEFIRKSRVLFGCHPLRLALRFAPAHQMVARPQPLAAPKKIGRAHV